MKLLSNRDKDRTHVRDLIGVGLIDRTWLARLPAVLAERLQGILDTPFVYFVDFAINPATSRPSPSVNEKILAEWLMPSGEDWGNRIALGVARSVGRALSAVVDIDRLADQFLPRRLLVVGEQGIGPVHVLFVR